MPAIPNIRQEAFAQAVARGEKFSKAYVDAGYKASTSASSELAKHPAVMARVAEIVDAKRKTEEEARQKAVKKLSLTEEWIIERLMYNAERCLRGQPVVDPKTGEQIPGKYTGKPDSNGANRALELLGKYKGMFIDRHEFGAPGAFSAMSDEQLDEKLAEMGQRLGIPPKVLAAMRAGETKH